MRVPRAVLVREVPVDCSWGVEVVHGVERVLHGDEIVTCIGKRFVFEEILLTGEIDRPNPSYAVIRRNCLDRLHVDLVAAELQGKKVGSVLEHLRSF